MTHGQDHADLIDNNADMHQQHALISSDRVEGTAVFNSAGDRLGTIKHFMVEKQSGQAKYAVMSFGGFLGMGSDHFPIPWNSLTYSPDRGGYTVDISQEELKNAPNYPESDDQRHDSAFMGRVDSYYTPVM
jgi:hypothetical protein